MKICIAPPVALLVWLSIFSAGQESRSPFAQYTPTTAIKVPTYLAPAVFVVSSTIYPVASSRQLRYGVSCKAREE